MKIVLSACRVFIGLVFVFSGFVKGIDPHGFAIKFEEYLLAFHLDFLVATALPFAILLSAAELMIGLNMLFAVLLRFSSWMLVVFMSLFTVLTFILALTNPVTDCGCFGDAVKLTNWQTFWKNIIIDLPALLIFLNRHKLPHLSSPSTEWLLASFNILMPVCLSVYCIIYQPILDFRPYSTGTHIPDKMVIPEGEPTDVYETTLIYEKDGVQKEFTETTYPWQDSTWKWVETKQKLISRGMVPPIHDFSITTMEGNDITEQVLADGNYTLLIVVPKLEHASNKGMQRMNELAMKAVNLGFPVYCLTSSATSRITAFNETFRPAFDICTTDETTLKTIIRANPGLVILRGGTILGKWNFHNAPKTEQLQPNLIAGIIDKQRTREEYLKVAVLALAFMVLYFFVRRLKST